MSKKKKISASDYYSLATVRAVRRLLKTEARKEKWKIFKGNMGKKMNATIKPKITLSDKNGGNILKTRRYKGRIFIKK